MTDNESNYCLPLVMVTLKKIQRKDEKVLRVIAFIFSSVAWLALAAVVMYVFSPYVGPLNLCFFPDDQVGHPIGDSDYSVSFYREAISWDMESLCISEDQVPDQVRREGFALASRQTLSSRRSSMSIALVYGLVIIGGMYSLIGVAMAQIRLNGLRLSPTQYPAFHQIFAQAAHQLDINKSVPAYVIDANGVANAFAVKIARKRMVVFYAELIERLVEEDRMEELKAIAAHELTHVKLRHINYWLFLLPFRLVPFINKMLSRRQELSCDRGALFVVNHEQPVIRALVKLVAGKQMTAIINFQEYVSSAMAEKGLFVWLAKILSTHPYIPYRLKEIEKLSSKTT